MNPSPTPYENAAVLSAPASQGSFLRCPIRGILAATAVAADGLTLSEEARRIEFIKFLLKRNYPAHQIGVETVILKRLGNAGRNKLRCDVIAYDIPAAIAAEMALEQRLEHAVLVAEIKRDSDSKSEALDCQLIPALRQIPSMHVLGAYWDDVNQLLFTKRMVAKDGREQIDIANDSLANLPSFGTAYQSKPLTFNDLTVPAHLFGVLWNIANVMRSHGISDEHLRYKEIVKLLLARYCDEREAAASPKSPLGLQVYEGQDNGFSTRVRRLYGVSAKRYSRAKTLFTPKPGSELKERTLKEIVRAIQGIKLSAASNQAMQDVFQTFVPAVFKKSLDQYFTPISLIEAMVEMADIGPNDKVADPAMGTADFLATAMDYRTRKGDTDAMQRVYGVDSDQKAFDLAIVNMILNRDGQSNLLCEDSIFAHKRWAGEMNVVLCNPPFGENSVEDRPAVLAEYELGHQWAFDSLSRQWIKSGAVMRRQQLGILFIERCFKLLSAGGRMAIILPEGYLSTPVYGYVRQWLTQNFRILSLIELPRRIFVKSNADLRSNILIAQKLPKRSLKKLVEANYPIHADLVRKPGFQMGRSHAPTLMRDPSSGSEVRDAENRPVIDSDFIRAKEGFDHLVERCSLNAHREPSDDVPEWTGARINDILEHQNIDLKPRRLSIRAIENVRSIRKGKYIRLGDVADVVEETFDLLSEEPSNLWRMVRGLDIRAVEGIVAPEAPGRAWELAERERNVYILRREDIVVGLVRPERRNIGMLLDQGSDVIGSPDGIAVVRVKEEKKADFPQEWLFAAIRSEPCRIQLWTESGGTSYGKLNAEHLRNLQLPAPPLTSRLETAKRVKLWAKALITSADTWLTIGTEADRRPIINSAAVGLMEEAAD